MDEIKQKVDRRKTRGEQTKSRNNRDILLKTAEILMAGERVTIDRIAAEAGLSPATVRNHCPYPQVAIVESVPLVLDLLWLSDSGPLPVLDEALDSFIAKVSKGEENIYAVTVALSQPSISGTVLAAKLQEVWGIAPVTALAEPARQWLSSSSVLYLNL